MDSHTKKNYRPSNQVLESLQLSTHVSTSEGLWTQEDDVRLIRAYECFNSASWVDIVKLFPNRHKHSVKTRYRDHLKRQTGDLAISVPPELMFGCIPPTKQSSNAQNAIRSEDTMVPALLVSGQPSNDPARPEVFVIFRESGYNKDSEIRTEHFQSRSEELVKVYFLHIGNGDSELPIIQWALIKNKSTNTNFSESNNAGVVKVRSWLVQLQEKGYLGRVLLIVNQVDGFSTNVNSLKTMFDLCRKLDLWMFFVHEADRRSLLHFQTLQGIIAKIEQGNRPKELLEDYPTAHDYLLTLMFMTGVSVNKRNLSKNMQAQKQLGVGNRNHFLLDTDEHGFVINNSDQPFLCPRLNCNSSFKTSKAMNSHVQKDHIENEEIDEFAAALGLHLGSPVTPLVIGQLLSDNRVPNPSSNTHSERSLPHFLPGVLNPNNPVLFNTRLVQPTTFVSDTDAKRVHSRPSDEQITHLVLGPETSAPGEKYTLEDDVRIIRLKEIEGLSWQDLANHFPGRDWKTLQKRYATKLTKVVRDHRPDEVTIKMLRGQSSGQNFTPEEDLIIIRGKEIDLLTWSEIAQQLPTRNAMTVKSRYFRTLKPYSKQSELHMNVQDSKLNDTLPSSPQYLNEVFDSSLNREISIGNSLQGLMEGSPAECSFAHPSSSSHSSITSEDISSSSHDHDINSGLSREELIRRNEAGLAERFAMQDSIVAYHKSKELHSHNYPANSREDLIQRNQPGLAQRFAYQDSLMAYYRNKELQHEIPLGDMELDCDDGYST
ncbi:hypothetical protein V8E51_004791 [Hyaloscypha variabilis]